MTTIGELMRGPVLTVDVHQSLAEALEIMAVRGVRHLAVLDRTRVVGVLSERDLMRLEAAKPIDPEVLWVGEAMTPEPYIVAPGTDAAVVVEQMARAGHGSALVGNVAALVGMFTTTDALHALAERLRRG